MSSPPSALPAHPRARALPRRAGLAALAALALLSLAGNCSVEGAGFAFVEPAVGFLSAPGDVAVRLALPPAADPASLRLELDGDPLAPGLLGAAGSEAAGTLPALAEGAHRLVAEVSIGRDTVRAVTEFTLVSLERPDECEILNAVSCALPFPSSRFLVPDAGTDTGLRVAFAAGTLPTFNRIQPPFGLGPLDPAPYNAANDGFSPTAQILMHFPGGMDPVLSDAPRIDPATRVYGARGLDPQSPTLLIDYDTGERINHFVENDARATDPARVLTFLRPARSLRPGHRYIVAARRLVDAQGGPVAAEPVFANIRNGQPSDLAAVNERRAALEPVLARLEQLGVARGELILAFDFTVQSDRSLTHEMLTMRDEAFAWLDAQRASGRQTFVVTRTDEINPGCADPDQAVWRFVEGTFEVPLYLGDDPFLRSPQLGFLVRDASGKPVSTGVTHAPFGIAIPCAVFDAPGGFRALPPLLVGHGLFGEGPGTVRGLTQADALADFRFVAGATNWSGLSTPDLGPSLPQSFVFKVIGNLDNIGALADRLRQGQLDTLVLGRMLKGGDFNVDPAFQTALGEGVLTEDDELYYFGASLGGIMGTMFAALTPDAERLNVDVPAINFSLLLQRATPFLQFEILLDALNPDAMDQAIGLGVIHELWVRGEPAGYATHVTDDPLPGVPFAKRILMTVALYDQQVSNLGSILAGNTLRLPNLEGSVLKGLPGMPDAMGPQDSGFIVYDTAGPDPEIPAHRPFIPPITNLQAQPNRCDPHGRRGFIPASVDQLLHFLTPTGRIENFCTDDGICNASAPEEQPFGGPPCDPLG